ncbi:(2Fe-2S)-binding protein [Gorillibacterium sp. sgz5001074]|uniref:(2Fe-2S)-binding protein n=1 Tax=Gorillibacterium sp. sgz5001074 TaxID=3446695 RepID=UPI003F669E7B
MAPLDTALLLKRHRILCPPPAQNRTAPAAGTPLWSPAGDELPLLLAAFGRAIQSPSGAVTGSLFVKRLCSLAAGAIYAWTHHGAAWDTPLSDLRIGLEGQGLVFHLPAPAPGDTSGSLPGQDPEPVLDRLMAAWISPLVRETVRCTGVPEDTLWSTLSYHLAYWEREWTLEADATVCHRVEAVFRMLREPGRPHWFLGRSVSPLAVPFRTMDNPCAPNKPILLRSKCCMNYRLPGEDRYCYTCPRLNEEQRMTKISAVYGGKQEAQATVR